MFGIFFPGKSYPLDISKFCQVDSLHWLLDMGAFVGMEHEAIKDVCIFLLSEGILPPDRALAVYVRSPGSDFQYRGAVHAGCPSAVLPLLWPPAQPTGSGPVMVQQGGMGAGAQAAQIGISVEPAASLALQNVGWQKRIEEVALKVGQNLFNYMQSFSTVQANMLMVPTDILDLWFRKFQEKARVDPDFLNRFNV